MTTAAPPANTDRADQTRILKRLLDVSLVLNSNLTLDRLLHDIMDAASEITNSASASILLIDKRTNELFFAGNNSGDEQKMAHIPVPLNNSIAGTIILENRAVIIQDASNDPRINRTVDQQIEFQTRSLMGVPMRIKNSVIGALEVVNRIGPAWTEDDCTHLTSLAAQAAVAIENARQAEQLHKAYEELDKLDKLKSDFIAIASHELRTPLSIIIGYASFLQEEASGEAGEHAAAVLNSAQHLGEIIEELTNLRFLRVASAELTFAPASLLTVLQDVEHEIASLVNAKNEKFDKQYPAATVTVNADTGKLEMALTNILNNAVKFTDPGGTIRVFTEQHGGEIWIRVADNGLGIPATELENIFKDFYQVSDHMTRKHNGMGLGLSIARAVVQAHGGRVWAESEGLGHGTTITISLPVITT
jgi:signal transduction histidine kinase